MNAVRTTAPAVQGCIDALQRCRGLVEFLPKAAYTAGPPGHDGIGAHLRHSLDHFTCLLRGLESGILDYDARDRHAALETQPEVFHRVVTETLAALERIAPESLDMSLQVMQRASLDAAPTPAQSSLERELVFLSGHTIHHLAIMMLLSELNGCPVPSDFGVAYSTAAHRNMEKDRK